MRHRLWMVPFLMIALVLAGVAFAEPIGSHWELTPFGGYTLVDGRLLFPGSGLPLRDTHNFGARLGWRSTSWIAIEAAGGLTSSQEEAPSGRDFDWLHASGNLVISPAQGRYGGPFAFVGAGYEQSKPGGSAESKSGTIEFGGGLKLWLTDALGLRFEARDVTFKPLAIATVSPHVNIIVLGAGVTFAFGARARDTDGDGVDDKTDKCPNTPRGAKVDANGCPLDSDGDGVFDGLDQCEGTPKGATVDAKGCPSDADGDGVWDGIDQCPDTPKGATVDAKGCPSDSDGDGVLDGLDKCPHTPKGATVDASGCPSDADGDGVFDGLDQCADTPPGLKVDEHGCPIEVMERETELLDTGMIRLQNVNFETNKADILPESYPTLDVVGMLLSKWPQLKLEIGGHTDARGSAAKNLKLSQARADSVRAYVLRKFDKLVPEQFTVKGYGKTKPIVPNTSELNWAKNRRVEFVVMNNDVFKKEIERRRLLKTGETAPPAPEPTPSPTPAPADTTKK